jgi:hypothetical protein
LGLRVWDKIGKVEKEAQSIIRYRGGRNKNGPVRRRLQSQIRRVDCSRSGCTDQWLPPHIRYTIIRWHTLTVLPARANLAESAKAIVCRLPASPWGVGVCCGALQWRSNKHVWPLWGKGGGALKKVLIPAPAPADFGFPEKKVLARRAAPPSV